MKRIALSRVAALALGVALAAPASPALRASFGEAAQAPTVTAIRAGRLLDPDAGQMLTNQIILDRGHAHPRRRTERRDSAPARR